MDGWAIFALVTRRDSTVLVRQACYEPYQGEILLLSTPRSPRAYEQSHYPIGGVSFVQRMTRVRINPSLNRYNLVSRQDVVPVRVWESLGVTGDAKSELVIHILPPCPDESHHFLLRRQGKYSLSLRWCFLVLVRMTSVLLQRRSTSSSPGNEASWLVVAGACTPSGQICASLGCSPLDFPHR